MRQPESLEERNQDADHGQNHRDRQQGVEKCLSPPEPIISGGTCRLRSIARPCNPGDGPHGSPDSRYVGNIRRLA